MSDSAHVPSSEPPADDRGAVEALVAACIEALERGEKTPATRICAERPELLPRVQRRLAQLAARGLIPATDDAVPDAIGPYRIVRDLGSGGMGSVYLAEQAEPMRRLVALKIVKLGMDTREVVARFEKERQALALMSHPNIAQVFDAGITPAGRPYFALEYVDGLGLARFCDGRAIGPEERVRLLAAVAKDPRHRYATALAFAEDLERWLRNDPVVAAPPARTYRLRKFVRRNRAAVAVLAATIAIAAASWFVLASATQDDRRLETAKGDADRLLARATAPQDDAARQTLGREALARYDALLRDQPDDLAFRKGRCQALINLSEVHLNLGQLHDAERTGLDALADARGLLADRPDEVEFRRAFAESARRAGRAIWRLQRADEAKPLFAEAVKHLDACFAQEPTRTYGLACSAAWRELSTTLVRPGERNARVDALQRSTDVLAQLVGGGTRDPNVHRHLVISRSELAIRLADAGRIDDADVEAERAAEELTPIRGKRGQAAMIVQQARATVADKLGDGEAVAERVTAAIQAAEQWRLEEPDHLPPGVALAFLLAWSSSSNSNSIASTPQPRRSSDRSSSPTRCAATSPPIQHGSQSSPGRCTAAPTRCGADTAASISTRRTRGRSVRATNRRRRWRPIRRKRRPRLRSRRCFCASRMRAATTRTHSGKHWRRHCPPIGRRPDTTPRTTSTRGSPSHVAATAAAAPLKQ